ncbi:Detected protein of confused Function [Hibiscus syriacus]|uniref:Detected protein of confused Function n=1 Tax=Hibiscus syriacus TaxID=106335 RepID=A0A6A3AA81_HIBSY|nr:Detected protein of confused Function [Hibiscus syriacus]
MFNNEKGFSSRNIESVCSVGRSTKKGNRRRGYIGEKGIGFKSVFLICSQPYIFSNGYQIRFNEAPCSHCNLGYIVPEWIDENPTIDEIGEVYGSCSSLPTTVVVLPLKPDKVKPVKQQLIKRLTIREHNEDPRLNTVSGIAIKSETNFITTKSINAESYTLLLSAEEENDKFEKECSYHTWKQRILLSPENQVERRMDVDELEITLAFPNQERLQRGMKLPGVYAFLPTEMVTDFPFIIQADFLLSSSRETILLDNKWNKGILDSVPGVFVNAFTSLVKLTNETPVSSLRRMFDFLPVNSSVYQNFNAVRDSVRSKLVNEDILPSDESCTGQKFFHKPNEGGRIMPAFWDIIVKARMDGLGLSNLSSHGTYVLHPSFDMVTHDNILNFLGVGPVDKEWYAKCIQGSDLVLGVSEGLYLELLLFLAENWKNVFDGTAINNVPILKYVDLSGRVSLCSISNARSRQSELCSDKCYGKDIHKYTHELKSIGVVVEFDRGVKFVPSCLCFPQRTDCFLEKAEWCPDSKANWLIWIPDGDEHGRWVEPDECVLHDKDGLFGMQLNILEKHYKNKVPLQFFSGAFDVKSNPSLEDYCKLWKGSSCPILFSSSVWYPQPSLPLLPQTLLLELYAKIGRGLLRLILGFLACSMKLEADRRREAVQSLLDLTVLETSEPIAVGYTLLLSSGEALEVHASRMVRWDKEYSKLFIQKMDESAGQKDRLEYATYFSETVAEGLLWEKEDQISSLAELIKLAYILKFNEDAVELRFFNLLSDLRTDHTRDQKRVKERVSILERQRTAVDQRLAVGSGTFWAGDADVHDLDGVRRDATGERRSCSLVDHYVGHATLLASNSIRFLHRGSYIQPRREVERYLCRKMEVPYCIVKGKSRLGSIVHKKTASVSCLTTVKNEDKLDFSKILEAIKANFNDKYDEYRKKWGGGVMGSKSQARTKAKEKLLAKEAAQTMT